MLRLPRASAVTLNSWRSSLRSPSALEGTSHALLRPDVTSFGAALQVRHGPKDGRPGRLQHHIFGCDKAKGRYYYRFHKLIGKWNWRKYTERYIAPRALENRQRWIPTPYATYTQMRHAYSWYWRLPKALAAATTSDEVLEAWIRFRHKLPKKTYHYFKVLKRLSDVGGCDATDWRLKFITSRLKGVHRKVLNLPRLAKYYADLRVIDNLEHLSRFLYPMLPKYSPSQLALTVHAFGHARVQDKRLMSEIAGLLDQRLAELSPIELVRLAEAFAATEVSHNAFLGRISAQFQVRVQQASEGQAPLRSSPSFAHLVDVATAFAHLKFQDFSYMEMCAYQAEQLLRLGLPGPTPPALARLCTACSKLKVHEVRLYEVALAHATQHWYDYPAGALAEMGAAMAPTLPREPLPIKDAYTMMLGVISAGANTLSLKGVGLAARFMAEVDHKGEFMPGLARSLRRRIVELRENTRDRYDIARVAEILARRMPDDRTLFSCLCRHLHRHLAVFEPVDFVRFARGLAASQYRDDRVAHALTKWARKRAAEFSAHDWDSFVLAITAMRDDVETERELRQAAPALVPLAPLPLARGDTARA